MKGEKLAAPESEPREDFVAICAVKEDPMTHHDISSQKLVSDLKQVVSDAEDLLRATAGQAGEKVQAVRARVEESLKSAREKLVTAEQAAVEQAKQAAKATDVWVHDNPWKAVGVGALMGFMLGWILHGRRD